MPDLIHRDGLKQTLLDLGFYPAIVKSALEKAPTVDAVPVVRCKDCKWSKRDNLLDKHWCKHFLCESEVRENDYCSYGERRDGDGNG